MRKYMNTLMLLAVLLSAASIFSSCNNEQINDTTVIAEGYVRHVILWTLSEELSPEEKLDVISYAKSSMEVFEKDIPDLVKAEVIFEKRLDSSNCDFMFDMYFTSRKALEEFSVNPDHLAVVAKLKPFITGRTCLDVML